MQIHHYYETEEGINPLYVPVKLYHWRSGSSVRQWSRRPGFNPKSCYTKDLKWYLTLPCLTLSNIRYVSRVKWSNPGKELRPSQHLGIVAIEKGVFWSLSTTITNFTYPCTYRYIEWVEKLLTLPSRKLLTVMKHTGSPTYSSWSSIHLAERFSYFCDSFKEDLSLFSWTENFSAIIYI